MDFCAFRMIAIRMAGEMALNLIPHSYIASPFVVCLHRYGREEHTQHRHHGPYRCRQDDNDGKDTLLYRREPQDRRGR